MRWVRRLAVEPLVHFLCLGGLIFLWFAAFADTEPEPDATQIVISSAELDRALLTWTQRRNRPPDTEEMRGIVNELIRDEVLYREALALGLDRDDVVIRSLLRQKFEFVTQDLGFEENPNETVLRAFLAENAGRYTRAARLSFSQILFSEDRRGPSAETDALQVLAVLQTATGPEAAEIEGDGRALAPSYRDLSDHEIAALFGPAFAAALLTAEPGRWSAPIRSGYGLHLVWVESRTAGGPLPFKEVAQRVRDDWVHEQRRASNDAIFARLLDRYEVVVEPATALDATAGGS